MKEQGAKTKRLVIRPMSDQELAAQIATESDFHLKQAFSMMLNGSQSQPEQRLWYVPWQISLRNTGEKIGSIGFHGAPQNGEVEIGYGIDEAYRNQGFATEAANTLIEWAFGQEDVYFITAQTDGCKPASARVLEKLQFAQKGMGAEGPRYERERPPTSWMSVYMCLGMSLGICFGVSGDHMPIGMSVGMCLGLALGLSLDQMDRKKRTKLMALRNPQEKEEE